MGTTAIDEKEEVVSLELAKILDEDIREVDEEIRAGRPGRPSKEALAESVRKLKAKVAPR